MPATGLLSKGIELQYKKDDAFVTIPDLQDIPDLGGDVDLVEVTTLADGARRYINGIKDFGDLGFTFLYDNTTEDSSYRICRGLEEAHEVYEFKVVLPDETEFTFSGGISTKINGAGVNDALTFTATISLNSDMEVVNPQ